MAEITELSLAELSAALEKKETSSEQATKAYLSRIESVDPKVGAYLLVDDEGALKMARESDERRAAGNARGPLEGVPVALKDIILSFGVRSSAASKILENFIPPYESTVAARLRAAGAVFLGKVNMDEFAMGSSTENSAFQKTRNPWDQGRIPGGSSGGSAAAVAADLCAGALGTDTGGSIRQPASHCGIVGLKPTYGRVSRYGVMAFASSLDQVGPMGKSVEDCALMFNTIGGHDAHDSTSIDQPLPDFVPACRKEARGLRIGVPRQYFGEGLGPDVEKAVKAAIATIEGLGNEIVEVDLPHSEYAVATYYLICTAEASSNLARYDGVRYGYRSPESKDLMSLYLKSRSEGFGPEVKRRIMLGTYCLSAGYYDAYYKKAQQVRRLILDDFTKAFEKCDAIVGPVTPTPAFKFGEKTEDPLEMYLSDIYTISVNLAGLPGMSLPCGFSQDGLPIGLQVIAPQLAEETLFQVAAGFERACDLGGRRPAL